MLQRMKKKAEVAQKAAQEVAVDQDQVVVLAQMKKIVAQTVEATIQVEAAVNLVQRERRKRRRNSMQLIRMRKLSLNQSLSST